MKKLLVVLLALTFVVAMATAAFAVTTASVDGKVEWTYTSADQFGGSVDGKLSFDLGKDFGEGYSAGLKIKITPNGADAPNQFDEVAYDGDGWIKMVKDFGTITFQTGGLGGNAANELGGQYDMSGNAGVKFESTSLMEGLALTVVLNDNYLLGAGGEEANEYLNYLLKGVYTADALTIGAGYQMHTQPASVTDSAANDMMAVWAGYKLSDALSFGLEYGSRPNVGVDGASAILVKADYTAAPLTVNGKVRINTGVYDTIDDGDIGTLSAWNAFINGVDGMALKVDASYQLTDALSVGLTIEDILSNTVSLPDDALMSYKLSVTDKLSDAVSVTGSYAGYGDLSEIDIVVTDTLVAGLVASLEVKSDSTVGSDAVNSYTAKIVATL